MKIVAHLFILRKYAKVTWEQMLIDFCTFFLGYRLRFSITSSKLNRLYND